MSGIRKTPVGMPQDRDFDLEHWLQSEVARTYDEVMASSNCFVPAETVRERLHLRHLERRTVNDH
jgi:seryl-tRNA synthetase